MEDSGIDRLAEAKQRMYGGEKAQRRQEQLRGRLREQERLITQLEVRLESEQADVDKLTRMSLANLFHTLLRNKEEELEQERQEVLAAALKLQEAKQTQAHLKDEIVQIGNELAHSRNAEREYAQLLAEKEALLRNATSTASELAAMEAEIGDQSIHVKEVGEALTAGKRVLASLEEASNSLDKAEDWGKWDMWGGGGLITTHIKHGHVDDAKQAIGKANRLMASFRDELADLSQTVRIEVDISSMLKFGDYWFDGLITDWVVQKRIKQAHEQTLDAIHQVRKIVGQLQSEFTRADSALRGNQSKRVAWIEQQRL